MAGEEDDLARLISESRSLAIHVHPDSPQWPGLYGPCPIHPDAPGDH